MAAPNAWSRRTRRCGCPGMQLRQNAIVEVDLPLDAVQAPPPRQQRCFLTDIPISIRPDLLVHELQRELHLAWRFRLKDMVERWRTDVAVGQPEVRAVQDVKQLRAELYMH